VALGCTICGGGQELDVFDPQGRRPLTFDEVATVVRDAVRDGLLSSGAGATLPARCECGAQLVLLVEICLDPPTTAEEEAELDDVPGVSHMPGATVRLVAVS
jgi:hypothetical protein